MTCTRCGDEGVVLWSIRLPEGTRYGPCPKCLPVSAKAFCDWDRARTWPKTAIIKGRDWRAPIYGERK